jgi:acetyltransferase-like isoleucine patch superfamily enzyme
MIYKTTEAFLAVLLVVPGKPLFTTTQVRLTPGHPIRAQDICYTGALIALALANGLCTKHDYAENMIHDHRPYQMKRLYLALERRYAAHFIAPQLAHLGSGFHLMKPWNIRLHGDHISLGDNAHIVTADDRQVSLSTWQFEANSGHIEIGDNCLLCPGVRIDSASRVKIGDNCMLAAGSYLTDADWHDIYDRTRAVGTTRPVTLGENVWIGDGAIVCKGVTIGENSVIGAGSVVTQDIPPNVIAAGNPARVVKTLDPGRTLVTRASIFADRAALARQNDQIDRYVLTHNKLSAWLRTKLFPRRGD